MTRLWVGLAAAGVAIAALGATASAEPRFAVREGLRCSHCHVNRTGGGMRTAFATSFAQTNLATYRTPGIFDARAGNSISFGANLRMSNRTVFPAHTSLEGTERESDGTNSFEITEANLYMEARAIPDRLTLYIDETVGPESASARELFVLVHGLPADGYVKAGRFMPTYGLRMWNDAAYVRQETGFNYANQDLGVELGAATTHMTFAVSVTNGSGGGNDPNLPKQVTASATYVGSFLRANLSFAWNDTSSDDFSFHTLTSGGYVGARLGRLVQFLEVDWIRGIGEPDTYDSLGMYYEANFEAKKGLFGRFSFEAFDPLRSLDNNARDRFGVGVSWFPTQLLEVRGEYRINRDIPQRVDANADELILELHGFL